MSAVRSPKGRLDHVLISQIQVGLSAQTGTFIRQFANGSGSNQRPGFATFGGLQRRKNPACHRPRQALIPQLSARQLCVPTHFVWSPAPWSQKVLIEMARPELKQMDIYVGNLPYSATEEDVTGLFAAYGPVERVKIITDRETGRSKGFAFVTLADQSQLNAAIEALNEQDYQGRALRVNASEPKDNRPGGFRSGGGERRGGGSGGGGSYRDSGGGGYGGERRGGADTKVVDIKAAVAGTDSGLTSHPIDSKRPTSEEAGRSSFWAATRRACITIHPPLFPISLRYVLSKKTSDFYYYSFTYQILEGASGLLLAILWPTSISGSYTASKDEAERTNISEQKSGC
jgi:cold-inducible RNA-binding protein